MRTSNSKKHRLVPIIIASILILLAIFGVWMYLQKGSQSDQNTKSTQTQEQTSPQNNIIHMAAMGDMLAHDTVIANAKTDDSYDFTKYFTNIRPSYRNADLVFCNQEGLSAGSAFGITGYPSLNAPAKYSADLQSGAGCNVINLANNHMADKGVAATNATIDVWNNLKPLLISGANKSAIDQNQVSFATINGVKVGFVAFADFNNNTTAPNYSVNNYHDEALVRRLMSQARNNSDVVIVSLHWGVEDSSTVSADQTKQANLFSLLGADVILGTGPHVLQKVQTINRGDGGKTVVWYSLGNMLSSQLKLNELIGGIAQFDIIKSSDNKISIDNLSFIPTYMHYEWTADQAARQDLLARHNVMIYLLKDATDPLSRSLFNTTVAAQEQYVTNALGSEVTIIK